jgi:hypothetical protein
VVQRRQDLVKHILQLNIAQQLKQVLLLELQAGYFVNTTCGAVTVTLPASPTAGDVVAFKDYASQWNTNAVTLCNNSEIKLMELVLTANLTTQGQSVSLIYVDATKGWQDIQDSTSNVTGNAYIYCSYRWNNNLLW